MRPLLIIIAILAAALPASAADFTFEPVHQVGMGGQYDLVSLHAMLTNTGESRDTFTLHKDENLPADWTSSFCEGETCYPPFLHDIEVVLDPGISAEILVDFQVNTIIGSGSDLVTITSGLEPWVTGSWTFAAIHTGCDVLIVDDSQDDLDVAGIAAAHLDPHIGGIWPLAAEMPTLADLETFPKIFWLTGDLGPSLDETSRLLVGAYLDGGGAILLSGQNLAQDICDPASPWYSAGSHEWFTSNISCDWVADYPGTGPDIFGEPGSFLGDDLDFSLDATQISPDALALLAGSGSVAFRYPDGQPAGLIRTDHGRIVLLGFGVEGVQDRGSLDILLDRICYVLNDPTSVETPGVQALDLLGNFPNPFNPKTSIRFVSARSGPGEFKVYDVLGRQLHSERIAVIEGRNEVNFTGAGNLSSGVYLYQIRLAGGSAEGRMVLAK